MDAGAPTLHLGDPLTVTEGWNDAKKECLHAITCFSFCATLCTSDSCHHMVGHKAKHSCTSVFVYSSSWCALPGSWTLKTLSSLQGPHFPSSTLARTWNVFLPSGAPGFINAGLPALVAVRLTK